LTTVQTPHPNRKMVVGIDAGGSSLRIALADLEGGALATAAAGSGDYVQIGQERFLDNLRTAWLRSSHSVSEAAAVCICAGIGCVINPRDAVEAGQLLRRLQAFSSARILCVNDSVTALEGAHAGRPGLHLVAGTGSVCVGKSKDGALVRVGGLGPLFDDAGSGYAIGRAALKLVTKGGDGRGKPPAWARRIFQKLDILSSSDLYRRIHGDADKRGVISSLAPVVFEEARHGDPAAVAILEEASSALAGLVIACADRVKWHSPAVTMSGSLVDRQAGFKSSIQSKVSQILRAATFPEPAFSPLGGAVQIARRLSMRYPDKESNTTPS
jgi:N-acetylglucosamine kinase-like BadF-type ATPase